MSLKSNLKIDWEVACLPMGHLRLSARAHRAVARFKTIGALLIAIRDSAPSAHWTPTVRTEIESVISVLLATVEDKGIADWDRFRSTRHPPKDVNGKSPLYFMSPALRRLDAKVGARSLATLHLHVRTLNALEQIGITTIGELVSAAATGLEPFPAAGPLTAAEIFGISRSALASCKPKGSSLLGRLCAATRLPDSSARDSSCLVWTQILATFGTGIGFGRATSIRRRGCAHFGSTSFGTARKAADLPRDQSAFTQNARAGQGHRGKTYQNAPSSDLA